MRGDRDCALFAYGFLGHALVAARNDAEALAGWTFDPDYQTALSNVSRTAGGLMASGALDPTAAFAALFRSAGRTGIIGTLGLPQALELIFEGMEIGALRPLDPWGWRDV